jgi:hypothetical protein
MIKALNTHDSSFADGQTTIARQHAQMALHHKRLMMQELDDFPI